MAMRYDATLSPIPGVREPRISTKPLRSLTDESSMGFAAIRFAEQVMGWELVPWQEEFLIRALELDLAGKLRFRSVLLLISRQNGKSAVMKVMSLYRLYADETCELVLGVAHKLAGAKKPWTEAVATVKSIPALAAQLDGKPRTANGDLCLPLLNGAEWRAESSEPDATRGWSVDLLFFDELRTQEQRDAWAAAKATTTARRNGQAYGVSNAGTAKSLVLREERETAIAAIDDPNTRRAIFEWSAHEDADILDINAWAQANPSLGYTLDIAVLEDASKSPDVGGFKTEHLCQWVVATVSGPWAPGVFEGLEDPTSELDPGRPFYLGIETSANRLTTYLTVAGWNLEGTPHVELIHARAGSEWVVPTLQEFESFGAAAVVLQKSGSQASGLIEYIEKAGLPVLMVGGSDLPAATGLFFDAVRDGRLAHLGQPALMLAAMTAQLRTAGAAWLWDLKASPEDIAPLVAGSHAHWALLTEANRAPAKAGPSFYDLEGGFLV